MNALVLRATVLVTVCALSACVDGVRQSVSPSPEHGVNAHTIVAAVGDSEQEVRGSIASASRAGYTARFVRVVTPTEEHVFSPYAQVLRTQNAIIVRGYGKMFIWSGSEATVFWSASEAPQNVRIPVVSAPTIDGLVKTLSGARRGSVIAWGGPTQRGRTDPWAGIIDPWQISPDYANVARNDGRSNASHASAGRKTSSFDDGICGIYAVGDNLTEIDGCYYYSYYYSPFGSRSPGGGGGVGGGSLPSPPPCPPANAPADLANAIKNDKVAQAVAQAVATNYGGQATQIITSASAPANEAAQANAFNATGPGGQSVPKNSITWYTTGVQNAVNSGQSEAQIFTHEELHLWYETLNADGTGRPNPLPNEPGFQSVVTVTLDDGTVLTFDISATNGVLNSAYTGYEHVMIHDDLVNGYGSDTTGAMGEALAEASSYQLPGQAPTSIPQVNGQPNYAAGMQVASANNMSTKKIKSGRNPKRPPKVPNGTAGCNTSASSTARAAASVTYTVNGYTITWTGAHY